MGSCHAPISLKITDLIAVSIETLQAHVLISQDKPRVWSYTPASPMGTGF